jgi:S-disulfanyl-L-cysteine oxidoreductase SoxD
MRCSHNIAVSVTFLAANFFCLAALAQAPDYRDLGRTPSQEEIRAWDIAIGVDGKELPPGSGTAQQGAEIYAQKCVVCHGPDLKGVLYQGRDVLGGGKGGPGSDRTDVGPGRPVPPLVGGKGSLTGPKPLKTIGSYWPFATTLWDFINRAMPRWQERTLTADEVYALTAFVLYKNDIIKENDVLDAKSLPKVQMPNRNGFLPARLEDIHDFKKRGCRLGQCPEQ